MWVWVCKLHICHMAKMMMSQIFCHVILLLYVSLSEPIPILRYHSLWFTPLSNKRLTQVFSYGFCKIFKNTFCIEHLPWLPLYIPSVKMPSRLRFTACNSWLGFSTRNSKILYHFVFCIILLFCIKRISFSLNQCS